MGSDGAFDQRAADEERCRLAGDLMASGVAQDAAAVLRPPSGQWWRQALAVVEPEARARARRRRRALLPALAGLSLAALALFLLVRDRSVRYLVEGAPVGVGGRVETAAGQRATFRFSDGTSIGLAGGSAGRVTARARDGANFAVERGRVSFDVAHRHRARWVVSAGPFEILVTGTRFEVDWSAEQGHALEIDLHAGSVTVRGALAGAGIALHAGQRLVAALDRGTLSLVDGDDRVEDRPVLAPLPPMANDRVARAQRSRAGRLAASAGPVATDGPEGRDAPTRAAAVSPPSIQVAPSSPASLPLAPERERLEPSPPRSTPPAARDGRLAAGGAACLGWAPQVRFDGPLDGAYPASEFSLAFTHAAIDHNRSWCGAGSLRVDANFDLSGAPNRFGDRPHHAGEALVRLPAPIDLTDKTLTVHFYVEGPPDLHFGAQIFAVAGAGGGDPKWVGGGFTPNLTTGRWWTISHKYQEDNRLFEGGTAAVKDVDRLTLQIYAIGQDRVWSGRVFVDDIGWQ
jgi:ferric-dicitrate binding protein FerR (iron transport regulator)